VFFMCFLQAARNDWAATGETLRAAWILVRCPGDTVQNETNGRSSPS
jgi:hypothetical protein